MQFDLKKFIEDWIGTETGIENKIVDKLKEIQTQYPDITAQTEALTAWLHEQLEPYVNVNIALNTLKGIALDILTGVTGVDPSAWMGTF